MMPTSRAGKTRERRLGLSIRALGGRLGASWERDRRDTLFLMGAVLVSVLPQMPWMPFWCSAGFLILFVWRLGLVFGGRPLPGTSVRISAAIAIIGAVYAQYHTLVGSEAGVALLILFLGLKLMEMRARRDLFVVIFLCCFLLLTGYFHSQGILMGAATMFAVLTLIASMLTMQFRQDEIPVGRRLRYAAVLLLQAIPVAAALFLLFPRPDGPLWGSPDGSMAARTGLSDSMSPGEISNLAGSAEVVMRVSFEGTPPPPAELYWRGPTFGHFDGRAWRPVFASRPGTPVPEARLPRDNIRRYAYTATLEPASRHWLLALDVPVSMPESDLTRVSIAPTFEMVSSERLSRRSRYSAIASPDALIGLNETRFSLEPWLRLPSGFNPRTLALAERWLATGPASIERRVQQVLAHFRDEAFFYTMTPPLLGRDSVDEFLFETRAGFCEHYTSAFVMLMRAMGIPARVVTGYQGAEANAGEGYWIVRQSNAHAWAEVWESGHGWRRVDPTAAVAPERIKQGRPEQAGNTRLAGIEFGDQPWLSRLRLNLDGLTHAWNQWLLSYDRSSQASLLSRLGLDVNDWREVAGAFAGALGLILGVIALLTLRPRLPRDPVERQYDEFCQRLAAVGLGRLPHETPNSFLHRIERLLEPEDAGQAREIVSIHNHLRYDLGVTRKDLVDQMKAKVRAFHP